MWVASYFIISFSIKYWCVNLGHRSDVLGDLRRMISLVVGSYFGMPPLLLPGLEPASPGTPNVLTRIRCLSLKPDQKYAAILSPELVPRWSHENQLWAKFWSPMIIETILNFDMLVAYTTDCTTSPVTLQPVMSLRHQSCKCSTSPVTAPPVLSHI